MPAGRIAAAARRVEALLGPEGAARKITGAAAARLGLTDRGVIRDRAAADVIVNGRLVVDLGEHAGALPGRAFRPTRGGAE